MKNIVQERLGSMRMPEGEEVETAWLSLKRALDKRKLPTSRGEYRTAKPEEFMLMPTTRDIYWAFKHSDTRNYVFVEKKTGKLVVPVTKKPFFKGEFDNFIEAPPVPAKVTSKEINLIVTRMKKSVANDPFMSLVTTGAPFQMFRSGLRAAVTAALASAGIKVDNVSERSVKGFCQRALKVF